MPYEIKLKDLTDEDLYNFHKAFGNDEEAQIYLDKIRQKKLLLEKIEKWKTMVFDNQKQ